jgi:hypothetical protein
LVLFIVFVLLRHVEGELYVVSFAFALTDHLQLTLYSWKELSHVESMNRNIKYTIVVVEHIACAISDMDVPIEDTDLALIKFFLGNSSCYCDVIEEAEAGNCRAVSMMPWRPHNGKDGVNWVNCLLTTKCSDGFNGTSSG